MVTRSPDVSHAAADQPTRPSVAVGWGFLLVTALTGAVLPAMGALLPWQVPAACAAVAAGWPGDHSPRACAVRLAHGRERAVERADADGREPRSGRARVYATGVGAGLLALAWAAASVRWWVLGGLAVTASGVIVVNHFRRDFLGAGIRRADSLTILSSGGGADGLAVWRSEVVDRWYTGVLAVPSLVLRTAEDPDAFEQAPRQIIGWPEIVADDVRDVPGGVAFAVDTRACHKLVDDVAAAVEPLKRVIDAAEVLIEPVPARRSFAIVTAYRGEPWHGRPAVDWRALRPVTGGRAVVPVGETAHADLLGADDLPPRRGPRPVLSGRQALLSSRLSLLIVSAVEMGKSGLIRAYLRGMLVQGVPIRPVVVDNKGEFAALAGAVEALGGVYVDDPASYAGAVDFAWATGESRYSDAPGYQHTPTLAEPQVLLIIAEWIDFVEWARASKSMSALRNASTIPRRHRGSSVSVATTAQGGQQKVLTMAREFFPQRVVLRVDNKAHVDMALGDDSLKRGAHAHLIPPDAQGVFWAKDRRTGFPYQGRAAWIPEHEQAAALVRPMFELADRMDSTEESA